jgi:nucleoside-diphosphate-sugar epimerase
MKLVALTGSTGFIGQHLLRELPARGYNVRVLLRRPSTTALNAQSAVIGDLATPYNLAAALAGVDAVIHSAGFATTMSGTPEDDFRVLNTEATVRLARAAKGAGVKRFVFMSSVRAQVGASAETTVTERLEPMPLDAYGRSKLAAERGIAELDIEWVALRPVLVYGAGAKGNIARLATLARSRYPLPFGALTNRRSMLSVHNLVDAVACVLATHEPVRRPLLVADDDALTMAEIVAAMRRGLGRRPNLVPVPRRLFEAALRAMGHEDAIEALTRSLVVDCSALRALGWSPRVSTTAGLQEFLAGTPEENSARPRA